MRCVEYRSIGNWASDRGRNMAILEQRGYYTEGREQLAALLPRPRSWATPARAIPMLGTRATRARAKALLSAGILADIQGDYLELRSALEQSLALGRELGDKQSIAHSLNSLGVVALNQSDYPAARSLLEEGLAIQRELGDKRSVAISLNNLAIVMLEQGDYVRPGPRTRRAWSFCRELGDRWGIANLLNNLGRTAYNQGDFSAARPLFEESLAM